MRILAISSKNHSTRAFTISNDSDDSDDDMGSKFMKMMMQANGNDMESSDE